MKAQILADFRGLPEDASPDDEEEQTMRIVLKRLETSAGADRIADALGRKPCCANNTGAVNGNPCDIREQHGRGNTRMRRSL